MLRLSIAVVLVGLVSPTSAHAEELPVPLNAKELLQFFDDGNFAEVERTENEARESRAINAAGFWQLERFYTVIEDHLEPVTLESIERTRAKFVPWSKAYPESASWRIALAAQLTEKGWQARGHGYAHTVTTDGWVQFEEYLTESWNLLSEAKRVDSGHPQIYSEMLTIGMGLGEDPSHPKSSAFSLLRESIRAITGSTSAPATPKPVHKAIFDEAMKHEPNYWPLYERYATAVLPRWGGAPGEVESFATASADSTQDELGDTLYARIAMSVLGYVWEGAYRSDHSFDWERIRSGLDRILQDYPESNWFANRAVRIACAHEQREDAVRYRAAMSQPAVRAWPAASRMQVMLDWLDGNGPYPTGGQLADAVQEGDTDTVQRLLAAGIEADAIGFTGASSLIIAAGTGRIEVARLLIAAGADLNSLSARGNTPLREACFKEDVEMINLLIDNGADPNLSNISGWLPLAQSVRENKKLSIETLLNRGADINKRMPEGWTALSVAVEVDNLDLAKYLLENGADPKARFDAGGSILALAKRKNNPAMIELIDAASNKTQ